MKPMDRYRICIAPNAMGQGGIGTSLMRLAHGFVDLGAEVDLVLTAPSEKDFGRLGFLDEGVHVQRLANRTYLSMIGIRRYLLNARPDIVITAHNSVFVAFTLVNLTISLASRSMIIHQIHTHRSVDLLQKSLLGQVHDWLMGRFIHYATLVVGVSSGVARDFESGVGLPAGSVKVIPNPIDDKAFEEAESPPDHVWFQEKSIPILLAVGRLTAQKDYPTLFSAVARVVRILPCRLVILGSGVLETSLQDLSRDMGIEDNVWFAGHVEDPKPFFCFSDVFVSSSAWEGMGVAHLEALAAGLPVVCTDCPSGPDEILKGGKYGHLVPVGDEKTLARAILQSLTEPMPSEVLRSRANEFSQNRVTAEYAGLFSGLSSL